MARHFLVAWALLVGAVARADAPAFQNASSASWEGRFSASGGNDPHDVSGSVTLSHCTATGCDYKFENGNISSVCGADGHFTFTAASEATDPKAAEGCTMTFKLDGDRIDVDSTGDGCNYLCGHSGAGYLAGLFGRDVPASKRFPTSFTCKGLLSNVERAVCTNAELAKLDVQLAAAYKGKLKGADAVQVKAAQRSWLIARDEQCLSAPKVAECVKAKYLERLAALGATKP